MMNINMDSHLILNLSWNLRFEILISIFELRTSKFDETSGGIKERTIVCISRVGKSKFANWNIILG